MTVISLNVEGLSAAKEDLIAEVCFKHKCSVLCLQEIQCRPQSHRSKGNGMTCIVEFPHDQYGNAIFVKEGTTVESIHTDDHNNIKTFSVNFGSIVITSVYKPPAIFVKEGTTVESIHTDDHNNIKTFSVNFGSIVISSVYKPPATPIKLPPLFQPHKNRIVIGDFNSHNIQWDTIQQIKIAMSLNNGQAVINSLVHDAKYPPSINNARWKAVYNPDIVFVNQSIGSLCKKGVLDPTPRMQHHPIRVSVHAAVTPTIVPNPRHFNFKRVDWISFTTDLENQIYNITPNPNNYKLFTNLVQNILQKHIPCECQTRYVPCLNKESLNMLDKYKTLYKEDPFAEDTITAGEQLMASMTQEHKGKWLDTIESTDMSRNSKKAWNLI